MCLTPQLHLVKLPEVVHGLSSKLSYLTHLYKLSSTEFEILSKVNSARLYWSSEEPRTQVYLIQRHGKYSHRNRTVSVL